MATTTTARIPARPTSSRAAARAWTQQAKLTASDGARSDYFGYSVAIVRRHRGGRAHTETTTSARDSGSAYVFVRSGTSWSRAGEACAERRSGGDNFGSSAAISGDTIVVGAYGDDDLGSYSGSAYVFTLVVVDADADGVPNSTDNCPTVGNTDQLNSDADAYGDACDNCPAVTTRISGTQDFDGRGDVCDNCQSVANFSQIDLDGDLAGDLCDICPADPWTNATRTPKVQEEAKCLPTRAVRSRPAMAVRTSPYRPILSEDTTITVTARCSMIQRPISH